jgi:hypothetical protein
VGLRVTHSPPTRTDSAWLAIHQLVADFAYSVDVENGKSTPELFTEDGWYESDAGRSTGRDAIRLAYQRRAERGARTSRHLFTNLRIRHLDGSLYEGNSVLLLFAEDGESPSSADPLLVADVHDEYLVEQGVALIKSRHLKNIFLASHAETVLPLGGD